MITRKKFLKMMAGPALMSTVNPLKSIQSYEKRTSTSGKINKPVVVSTWNFVMRANAKAWEILGSGGDSLDAVQHGVMLIEADPKITTVGLGGFPDRDGHVTLDACVMRGNGNAGSVACFEHIMHPVSVARLVMEKTPHELLVGEGALEFALSEGFKKTNLLTPTSIKAWKNWLKKRKYAPIINVENHDTIGMLALDENGHLSGACTTSGVAFKMHGRVGDSPIIGDGLFVDDEVGAATSTGMGEAVMRTCGSHTVVEMMRLGHHPSEACRLAVERIITKYPNYKKIQVGYLALNKNGEYGGFCLQKGFQYAVKDQKTDQLFNSEHLL